MRTSGRELPPQISGKGETNQMPRVKEIPKGSFSTGQEGIISNPACERNSKVTKQGREKISKG